MSHALDRIRERLTDTEAAAVQALVEGIERERTLSGSVAIRVLRLRRQRNEAWSDVSNGDTVWAIVRDGRVRTVMLRRSTQPVTPESMSVDRVWLLV